jgi:ABC-type branched-subunit amino acid transport system ATPase component
MPAKRMRSVQQRAPERPMQTTDSTLALDITALAGGYGEAIIVREISLAIRPGEICTILGKNGMGKSTLLKLIMGFLPIRGGAIRLFGDEITDLPPHRLARKGIAYAPQEQSLFQDLTVEQNLWLGLRNDRGLAAELPRIGELFPFLLQRRRQRAGTLSGGEQKMLLVARALLARPRLMLVDEVTEGLQPSAIKRIAAALRAERDRLGTTMLLIEQNVSFALSVANHYAVLKLGEIVDRGAAHEVDALIRINAHLGV